MLNGARLAISWPTTKARVSNERCDPHCPVCRQLRTADAVSGQPPDAHAKHWPSVWLFRLQRPAGQERELILLRAHRYRRRCFALTGSWLGWRSFAAVLHLCRLYRAPRFRSGASSLQMPSKTHSRRYLSTTPDVAPIASAWDAGPSRSGFRGVKSGPQQLVVVLNAART